MIGTLIVTHGNAADALLAAVRIIIGDCKNTSSFCVDWDDNLEEAKSKLRKKIEQLNQGQGVLVLTDLFGGTPTNIALAFHQKGEVEVITGVNLPMIMKAVTLPAEIGLSEAARQIKAQAQKAIYIASELL